MLVAVEDRESEEVQAELGRLVVDDEAVLSRLKPLYTADALDGIGKMLQVIRGRDAGSGGVEVTGETGEAWKKVHRRYRQLLMEEGRQLRDEDDRIVRKGLTPEEFEAEEARDFELPAPAMLRHRIRYFVDGLALGSEAFIEGVFEKNRAKMGVKRSCGARVPKVAIGGLRTLRDLRGGAK